jgi:gamma-glutamylputrescine oxidase
MAKLRSQWGTAPWLRSDAPVSRPAAASPDVAIVGGGLTGVSAAYHLAKAGISAIVYEAGSIGDGASGRTGGLVLEGTAAGILEQVDACVPGLRRLVDKEGIDCELALPGCWEIEHRKFTRMLPWSDDGRRVGIARAVAGGVVQPAALTLGIAQAAARLGAVIRAQTAVTRIIFEPEVVLETDDERVMPSHIVVATNAWINAVLPGAPPLHSSLTFACITEPLETKVLAEIGLGEDVPFYTSDLPYLWGRTTPQGGVVFGAGLVFGSPASLEATDVSIGNPAAVLDRLKERVRRLHPVLREVRFEAAWAGPIAFAEDSLPLLGPHPANPRVLVAGGYAGHGVALSVRAGELLALAIQRNHPLPKWGSLSRHSLGA